MQKEDKEEILHVIEPYLLHEKVQEMKNFIQHGQVTTYRHVIGVVKMCYLLNKKFNLNADLRVLLTGALLHDFYLYDWHESGGNHNLHGFTHPGSACKKAVEYFDVDEDVRHLIRTHMWPLVPVPVPRTREAWILCAADKLSSLAETLWMRK